MFGDRRKKEKTCAMRCSCGWLMSIISFSLIVFVTLICFFGFVNIAITQVTMRFMSEEIKKFGGIALSSEIANDIHNLFSDAVLLQDIITNGVQSNIIDPTTYLIHYDNDSFLVVDNENVFVKTAVSMMKANSMILQIRYCETMPSCIQISRGRGDGEYIYVYFPSDRSVWFANINSQDLTIDTSWRFMYASIGEGNSFESKKYLSVPAETKKEDWLIYYSTAGQKAISFSVPIMFPNGSVMGVTNLCLGIETTNDYLVQSVQKNKHYVTGIVIFSSTGDVISTSIGGNSASGDDEEVIKNALNYTVNNTIIKDIFVMRDFKRLQVVRDNYVVYKSEGMFILSILINKKKIDEIPTIITYASLSMFCFVLIAGILFQLIVGVGFGYCTEKLSKRVENITMDNVRLGTKDTLLGCWSCFIPKEIRCFMDKYDIVLQKFNMQKQHINGWGKGWKGGIPPNIERRTEVEVVEVVKVEVEVEVDDDDDDSSNASLTSNATSLTSTTSATEYELITIDQDLTAVEPGWKSRSHLLTIVAVKFDSLMNPKKVKNLDLCDVYKEIYQMTHDKKFEGKVLPDPFCDHIKICFISVKTATKFCFELRERMPKKFKYCIVRGKVIQIMVGWYPHYKHRIIKGEPTLLCMLQKMLEVCSIDKIIANDACIPKLQESFGLIPMSNEKIDGKICGMIDVVAKSSDKIKNPDDIKIYRSWMNGHNKKLKEYEGENDLLVSLKLRIYEQNSCGKDENQKYVDTDYWLKKDTRPDDSD